MAVMGIDDDRFIGLPGKGVLKDLHSPGFEPGLKVDVVIAWLE